MCLKVSLTVTSTKLFPPDDAFQASSTQLQDRLESRVPSMRSSGDGLRERCSLLLHHPSNQAGSLTQQLSLSLNSYKLEN